MIKYKLWISKLNIFINMKKIGNYYSFLII